MLNPKPEARRRLNPSDRRLALGLSAAAFILTPLLLRADIDHVFHEGEIIYAAQVNDNFNGLDDRLQPYEGAISIDDSDRVGIGTDHPLSPLHVVGTDNNGTSAPLRVSAGAQDLLLDGNEIDTVGDDMHLNFNSPNSISLARGGGNVSVGSTTFNASRFYIAARDDDRTSPLLTLFDQVHTLHVQNTQAGAWQFRASGTKAPIVFSMYDNEVMRITTDELVGIGSAAPQAKLHVQGDVLATNYRTLSDARLKADVEPIGGALDGVMALQGVSFTWIDQPDAPRQIGLIAQEVEPVFPDLVAELPGGLKSVQYDGLGVVLVEALKEQQALIDAQRRELDTLKARLDDADRRLDALGQGRGR